MKNLTSLENFISIIDNLKANSKALKKISLPFLTARNSTVTALNTEVDKLNPLHAIDFFLEETRKENYDPIDITYELYEIKCLLFILENYVKVIKEKINKLNEKASKYTAVNNFTSDFSAMENVLSEAILYLSVDIDSFKPFFNPEIIAEDDFQKSLDIFLESHNNVEIKSANHI